MRVVTNATQNAWLGGDYTGATRPFARVTIQRLSMQNRAITNGPAIAFSSTKQTYSASLFGQVDVPMELPNIKSVERSHSVDQDAATCVITMYNTRPLPLGTAPDASGDYDQLGYYCVDPETQVLSTRGWLEYNQISLDDTIFTLNMTTGKGEWKPVLEVFAKEYSGSMVSMESKSISALVTPNHRWAVTNKDRVSRQGNSGFVFKETSHLAKYDLIPTIREDSTRTVSPYEDSLVSLLGWILTDGSFEKTANRVRIYQSPSANPDKCEQIRLLLKNLDVDFYEGFHGEGILGFSFSGKFAKMVREIIPDKKLTVEFIRSLTSAQRNLLIDAMVGGDGGYQGGGTRYICTSDAEQAGVIQTLISLGGLNSRSHKRHLETKYGSVTMYYINIKKSKNVKVVDANLTPLDYQGIVWCPRTENGTFLARRSGRVYFTGNTFNRGATPAFALSANAWQNVIVPDRIIRTFEGFGFNASVAAEKDANLYPTGVWSIDDVQYTHDGLIKIQCRDLAKNLIEQIAFPPVVPFEQYPLEFTKYGVITGYNYDVVPVSGSWTIPTYDTSSTAPYVGISGSVYGHKGADAFDTSSSTYWLSWGKAHPDSQAAYEWIQAKFTSRNLQGVQTSVWGGPYTVFLSVYANGAWQGTRVIPYVNYAPAFKENGAAIKYVKSYTVTQGGTLTISLPTAYTNVTKIRLTFHHLYNSKLGANPYRAGVRTIKIAPQTTKVVSSPIIGGNYNDYSEIMKLLLAYGGFWWPSASVTDAGAARNYYSDGTYVDNYAPSDDSFLKVGRIWGDIEVSGAYGPAQLGPPVWDKKPIMDCLNYVKDILGWLFFVDESGGAIMRQPNIWSIGNYVQGGQVSAGYLQGPSNVITIDEKQTLIGMTTTVSSRNVRERIFISNITGGAAGMAVGYNPYPSGLRRIAGWSDQHFQTDSEAQIMADLIGLRSLFTFRTNSLTIVGNPAIQIDDQVKIKEHVTGESYYHYIRSLHSINDLASGQWTYDLETHWLGSTPFTDWVFNPGNLAAETLAYLRATQLSNVTGQAF